MRRSHGMTVLVLYDPTRCAQSIALPSRVGLRARAARSAAARLLPKIQPAPAPRKGDGRATWPGASVPPASWQLQPPPTARIRPPPVSAGRLSWLGNDPDVRLRGLPTTRVGL